MWTSEGGNDKISVWENPTAPATTATATTEGAKRSQIFTIEGVGEDPWLELITDDEGEFMAIGDTGKEWMGVAHFDAKKGAFNWVREFKLLDKVVSWTGMNVCLITNPDNHDVGTVGEEKGWEWYIYGVQRKAIQLMKVRPGQCWMEEWGGEGEEEEEEEEVAVEAAPVVVPRVEEVKAEVEVAVPAAAAPAPVSAPSAAASPSVFDNWLGGLGLDTAALPVPPVPTPPPPEPVLEPESTPLPPPPATETSEAAAATTGSLLSPTALLAKIGAPMPTFDSDRIPAAPEPAAAKKPPAKASPPKIAAAQPEDGVAKAVSGGNAKVVAGPPGLQGNGRTSPILIKNNNARAQAQAQAQAPAPAKESSSTTVTTVTSAVSTAKLDGSVVKDIVEQVTKALQTSLKSEMQKVGKAVTRSVKEDGEKTRDKTVAGLGDHVKEGIVEVMEKMIVPSVNAGMSEMFVQVNKTMSQGLAKMKVDGEKVQKQMDDVIREQGKIVKEVRKENEGLKKTIGALTNSIMKLTQAVEELKSIGIANANAAASSGSAAEGAGSKAMEEENKTEIERARVKGLMEEEKYDQAFMTALQASKLDLSLYTCSLVDVATIFHGEDGNCKVSQTVLLCLLQQIGSSLIEGGKETFGLEVEWITECSLTIEAEDPNIKSHLPQVKAQLLRHIKQAMVDAQARNMVVEKRRLQGLVGVVTAIGM